MDDAVNGLLDLPNHTLQHIVNAFAHIALLSGCGIQTLAALFTFSVLEHTVASFLGGFWKEVQQVVCAWLVGSKGIQFRIKNCDIIHYVS